MGSSVYSALKRHFFLGYMCSPDVCPVLPHACPVLPRYNFFVISMLYAYLSRLDIETPFISSGNLSAYKTILVTEIKSMLQLIETCRFLCPVLPHLSPAVLLNKLLEIASIQYCLDLADQLKNAILK